MCCHVALLFFHFPDYCSQIPHAADTTCSFSCLCLLDINQVIMAPSWLCWELKQKLKRWSWFLGDYCYYWGSPPWTVFFCRVWADKQSSLRHDGKGEKSFVITEHILLSSSAAYHICILTACALKIQGFLRVWTCLRDFCSSSLMLSNMYMFTCSMYAYTVLYVYILWCVKHEGWLSI